MKKIILIFLIMFSINVKAEEINFNKDDYISYFKKENYDIINQDCSEDIDELSENCKIIETFNKGNNVAIRLYEFNNESDAYDYYMDVYDDNIDLLENVETYNLDNTIEDSNYSYYSAKIANTRYFYMICVDNYVIKTNTDLKDSYIIKKVYKDLGFIKSEKNNTGIIFGIVFVIIALLTISILIVRKIIKKKRLNTGVK